MHRRAFLTTTAVGITTATAGCSSRFEGPNYQQCTKSFVPLSEIPATPEPWILSNPRKEAEAAVEDGEYTAFKLQYPELVSDDTTLWDRDNNRYYTHQTEAGILSKKLIFDEITPSYENSGEIKVSNQTTDTIGFAITISADGKQLIETELSIDPATDVMKVADVSNREYAGERESVEALPSVEFPNDLRDYEVEIVIETVEDEHVETATIEVHPWFEYYWVQISDDGVLTGSLWENDSGFFSEFDGDSKVGIHWECTQPPSGWPEEWKEDNR